MKVEPSGMLERSLKVEASGMVELSPTHEESGTLERLMKVEASGILEYSMKVAASGMLECSMEVEASDMKERMLSVEESGMLERSLDFDKETNSAALIAEPGVLQCSGSGSTTTFLSSEPSWRCVADDSCWRCFAHASISRSTTATGSSTVRILAVGEQGGEEQTEVATELATAHFHGRTSSSKPSATISASNCSLRAKAELVIACGVDIGVPLSMSIFIVSSSTSTTGILLPWFAAFASDNSWKDTRRCWTPGRTHVEVCPEISVAH